MTMTSRPTTTGTRPFGAGDLIDESARKYAEERLRIRGPDAGGALRSKHLTHAAVERCERLAIGHVHDRGRNEGTGNLRKRVHADLLPREAPVHGERECDGGIQMRARYT